MCELGDWGSCKTRSQSLEPDIPFGALAFKAPLSLRQQDFLHVEGLDGVPGVEPDDRRRQNAGHAGKHPEERLDLR